MHDTLYSSFLLHFGPPAALNPVTYINPVTNKKLRQGKNDVHAILSVGR